MHHHCSASTFPLQQICLSYISIKTNIQNMYLYELEASSY